MQRRNLIAAALALTALACEPGIAQDPARPSVAIAVFDPTTSQIPLPNDLVFQADLSTLPAGQAELLGSFAAAKGFPSDQEVPITIDFSRQKNNPDGTTTMTPVSLNLNSLGGGNLLVIAKTASGQGPVAIDPIKPTDYVLGVDRGTLTLHNAGHQPWAPTTPDGEYVVLVRGGPNGVLTTDGDPVYPSQVFYLLASDQDLADPANIGLLRAQTNSMADALALANQLNQLRFLYKPVFAAADQVFPHQELAVVTTFKIAPAPVAVELDPGRGLVPLPIDLLRNPGPTGKLTAVGACGLAGGTLDASGNCSSAAAGGFLALDGFSTTAAMLAPVSGLVTASTVNANTVFLYDLSNPAAPVQVSPTTLIYEPVEVTSSGLSPAVVLQPAGATAADPSSVLRTRPLKENTNYAVVITDSVKDKTGASLGIGTVGRILLFNNPVNVGGKSQLQGIDDATTGGLEVMRQQLKPVLTALASRSTPVTKDHVAMAYTFKTQSILGLAIQLAALPYSPTIPPFNAAAAAVPLTASAVAPATTFAKYGVNPAKVPSSNIAEFIEASISTFDLLDPASGAFNPDPTKAVTKTIQVLIAVPKLTAAPPLVAPLMVFRHGFGGGRADMLSVADGFAAKGMVTVAIDAAKHGDRSYCTAGDKTTTLNGTTFNVCTDGAACVGLLPPGAQGDAKPIGFCTNGFVKRPVNSECFSPAAGCNWTGDGIALVSANYLVSANFFRTRDTFRQDLIDQSQLIRAIGSVDPTHPPATGVHKVFDLLGAAGVFIDPTKVYFSGQSLGAIQGALSVAANPRISKAVLNVGGGTVVDVFTNSPAFAPSVNQLLGALGIAPGTSAYLQFLVVAKTILDPADPINFVGHITGSTLPNLLADPTGATAQAPKKLLAQAAFCDQTVPNPFNLIFAATAGSGPLPIPGTNNGFGGPGNFQLFYKGTAAPSQADLLSCPAPGGFPLPAGSVTHGFITDWASAATTSQAQSDAANFVKSDVLPNSLVVRP